MKQTLFILFSFIMVSCKKDGDDQPLLTGTVTDRDGHTYNTVKIGDQWWMAENLRTTKFQNGEAITGALWNCSYDTMWMKLTEGAYNSCYGDITDRSLYGCFYNWYAVHDSRNIAPAGWHVPADSDWTILADYLGGEKIAGKKLKDTGSSHWWSPWNNTNESGFTGLGGGFYGPVYGISESETHYLWFRGYWWSSTEYDTSEAWCRYLDDEYPEIFRIILHKNTGCSVRCVKD